MNEWARSIQTLVDEIDRCIKQQDDDALTLARLSERMGYSRFYVSRQFRAISGMQLGEYLRNRRLAFALCEASRTASVEPLFVAGLFYLLMNGVVSLVFSYLNRRMAYYKD